MSRFCNQCYTEEMETKSEYYNHNFMFTSVLHPQVPPVFPKTQIQIPCSKRKEHSRPVHTMASICPRAFEVMLQEATTETQTKPDLSEISGSLKSSSWAGNLLSKMVITLLSCVTFLGKLHAQELV